MTASPGTEEYAANLALGHALQPEIATMDDKTTRGRKVRTHFGQVRDALQREKDWNFNATRTVPPADPVADAGHFKTRFIMPADCLKVRYIHAAGERDYTVETAGVTVSGVAVDSLCVLTNLEAPLVEYSRRVESVRLWDALFLEVFGLRLGAVLARELGKSATLSASLSAEAERKLATASAVDSRESSRRKDRPPTRLELARRGGRSYDPTRLRGGP
jgi:hypothetical protein